MFIKEAIDKKNGNLSFEDFKKTRVYGMDLIELSLSGSLTYFITDNDEEYFDTAVTDLSQIILPRNRDLFQVILFKSLEYTLLPVADYSCYDFNDVCIYNCTFEEGSTISPPSDFFQNLRSKSIVNCQLPEGDFSKCNFKGVDIRGVKFTKNSKLPNTKTFLQDIKDSSLENVTLPYGNYDEWDFKDVNISGVKVSSNTKLKIDENTLKNVKHKYINRCIFEGVDFSNASLEELTISNTEFINCIMPRNKNCLKELSESRLWGNSFSNVDLSYMDFRGVNIVNCKFKGYTMLPISKDFFQNIDYKNASNCEFPEDDYSMCDFKGVNLSNTMFHKNAILPERYDFFKILNRGYNMILSNNVLKKIEHYDTNDVFINYEKQPYQINDKQKIIINIKNGGNKSS